MATVGGGGLAGIPEIRWYLPPSELAIQLPMQLLQSLKIQKKGLSLSTGTPSLRPFIWQQ
ncbi:hypothetical protein VCO01S_24670 [Vibrio comitans NBRC 102076]|uniref:Uncharacterized protein n=1 Tax=Vibrio comitans NBRC 102076 TaxID=1219078 RepID=A0A4Y3IQX6_9VIBR|nr:hypothetical protein VCO01S_24670 [Vibrio comitans NBRC 102076]